MLKPAYKEYLKERQIENLRFYKYAAVDKSPISKYILKPYWDFAITLFPEWIAPNLITLIGLFFMIFNVIVVCVWSPQLNTEAPNWINFSFAIGLWLYSTFDNVDGRQARRTGTSSPLGELFDHGCDAVNCTYVALLQSAALGLGHSPLAACLLFVTITGFYLSTAEEYYTGILYLGYVNGPTEGIIVTCLAFIWSGIFGVASWHVRVSEISWLSWLTRFVLPESTTFADVFVWGMVAFFLFTHLPVCIYSIIQACTEKGFRKFSVLNQVFFPLLFSSVIIFNWLSSPASVIFSEDHFILFAVYVGLLFGETASDIILAHLTKSDFPRFLNIYLSLIFMTLLVNLQDYFNIHWLPEYPVLVVLCILTWIGFMVRAIRVIRAFCAFLDIQCLVIPSKNKSVEQASLLTTQEEGSSHQYNTF